MMKETSALTFLLEKTKLLVLKNLEKILKILMGGTKLEITVIKFILIKKEAYENACKKITWLNSKK